MRPLPATRHRIRERDAWQHDSTNTGGMHTPVLIIFDKENRERDQDTACSFYRGGDCPHGVRIAKEDEDHHKIARGFDPPLERYERKIGPNKTYAFIEE